MKNFLLFCFDQYYPSGGWSDFSGDYESLEAAMESAANRKIDFWHIVDLAHGGIVKRGKS